MSRPIRGKLTLQGFRTLANSFTPQGSIFQRICQSGYLNSGPKKASFNGFSSFSSISQRLNTKGIEINKSFHNPFLVGAKRFYCVDPKNVRHFRPRWLVQNRRNVFIVVMVSSGVFITLHFGNLETVPYTNRTHWVPLSKALEKKLGERQFEKMKATFKGEILPPTHPKSVRVRMIANDIIDALERKNTMIVEEKGRETLNALSENGGKIEGNCLKEEGSQAATWHLDGINWEILVVDEPVVNAYCLPSGKIIVFTGLLVLFKSDAELATIIGHEVGHVVARHRAEWITKRLWFFIIQLILYHVVTPDIFSAMSFLLLQLRFSRRMELEADYIGLLLMASAGYDPRLAPNVFEKFGKLGGDSSLRDYLSTHPSGKKRAQLLAQAEVMEEALTIYKNLRGRLG